MCHSTSLGLCPGHNMVLEPHLRWVLKTEVAPQSGSLPSSVVAQARLPLLFPSPLPQEPRGQRWRALVLHH